MVIGDFGDQGHLSAEVTLITRSASRPEEARRQTADHVIVVTAVETPPPAGPQTAI